MWFSGLFGYTSGSIECTLFTILQLLIGDKRVLPGGEALCCCLKLFYPCIFGLGVKERITSQGMSITDIKILKEVDYIVKKQEWKALYCNSFGSEFRFLLRESGNSGDYN